MRSGIAQGEDGAPEVTRRVVRLLVLFGLAVAAYLVLCLFDHAARADAGSIDQSVDQSGATDPVASVKAMAAGARKSVPESKSIIPKSTAAKANPQRIHRPTIKGPGVHPSRVHASKKIYAPKIHAPKKTPAPSIRAGETVRRVLVRTSKLRRPTSDAVRDAARATVTPARTAVVRQKLSTPAQLPSLRDRAELPDPPPAELPAWPQPMPSRPQPSWPQPSWPQPSWPQPSWPQPSWPQPSWPQPPSWPQLPAPPQAQLPAWPQLPAMPHATTPALIRTTVLPSAPMPPEPSVFAQVCPLSEAPAPDLSGVTEPPTAQAQPRTAPPRQPADRSTSTGQARDSGAGNAPVMSTVSSSWRPEVAAIGRRPAIDLIARGRTVRYAGPPS
jgi:hypothetical protein